MAATTVNAVRLKMLYEDGGERTYTFDDVKTDNLADVKSKVQAINTELADSTSTIGAALKATFVNDNDEDNVLSPLTKITAANYTTTETDVIYDGN